MLCSEVLELEFFKNHNVSEEASGFVCAKSSACGLCTLMADAWLWYFHVFSFLHMSLFHMFHMFHMLASWSSGDSRSR